MERCGFKIVLVASEAIVLGDERTIGTECPKFKKNLLEGLEQVAEAPLCAKVQIPSHAWPAEMLESQTCVPVA